MKNKSAEEKTTEEILKDAATLHEDLRNYGNLKDVDKPLVVAGILLVLGDPRSTLKIEDLTGDQAETDGEKIYKALESVLKRAHVSPETKRDKVISQFSIIKDTKIINEINPTLGETPLKYYAKFLKEHILHSIVSSSNSEDILGRFYGQFMSYSGGDGQTLGIVLTPSHICDLFCDLVDIKPDDVVLDPCCGTGGFLVSAMHNMIKQVPEDDKEEIRKVKKSGLHGIELQPYMFSVATANMILRGDGQSNLLNEDFFKMNTSNFKTNNAFTVGLINPPYSQGSKKNPNLYEISFIKELLGYMSIGGRVAAIVPQSSFTGKTKEEQLIKEEILANHTLEGVISLNKDTFYRVGTVPCIAVFRAWEPHPKNKMVKFINFKDDGYVVKPHVGLIKTTLAEDKKQKLLNVWRGKEKAENAFCVETPVVASDEWLHSFFYFNEEIPTKKDFEKTVTDYLSFEATMIFQGRSYLFDDVEEEIKN